jgi:putative Holliday junction resolvase
VTTVPPPPPTSQEGTVLEGLVTEWQPVLLVVGMPHREGDEPHPMKAPIEAFMRLLRKRFGIAIETIDESLSSWEASRSMSRAGRRARNQKHSLDTMAAREILQTWFEEARAGRAPSASGR